MTRIVFRPAQLPDYRGARVSLPPPWRWWETTIHAEPGDDLFSYDQHPPDGIYYFTFGDDRDRVILTDPPSVLAETVTHYYNPGMDGWPVRELARIRMTVRVVWHEQPGPQWTLPRSHFPAIFMNCVPGQYEARHYAFLRNEPTPRLDYHQGGPVEVLRWPLHPTIRDGQAVPPTNPIAYGRGVPLAWRRWAEETLVPWQRELLNQWTESHQRPRPHLRQRQQQLLAGAITRQEFEERNALYAPFTFDEAASTLIVTAEPRNPEQDVLDEIDALVNDQLHHEASGYDHNINQERCHLCGRPWHGLTGVGGTDEYGQPRGAAGCPGAFATDDETRDWRRR